MTPAYVVDNIVTPEKFLLRGLWFGPIKPKRVIVWVHGLGGSAFSMQHIIRLLVDQETAVLTFNNRGFETITTLRNFSERKSRRFGGGAAREVFTECVDDIQGVISFVRKRGVKKIFLAGHSTGCQKSVYWASKKGQGVKGIFLLAPISDYAAEMHRKGKKKIAEATAVARKLIRSGKKHNLLPDGLWHEILDAQRFLSLYTPDSAETVFSYEQPDRNPRTLEKVRVPTLVVWAERDEYADRSITNIITWFDEHLKNKHKVIVIPKVKHSFRGAEKRVAAEVRSWMKASK